VCWLIRGAPYLSVGCPNFLRKMEGIGRAYQHVLSQFPTVMCEPLELHYLCLRNLGALDLWLMKDLILSCSWREVAWGAWLAALSPRPEYQDYLLHRRASVPHQQYMIDIALAVVKGNRPLDIAESIDYIDRIRAQLSLAQTPNVQLRRSPNDEDLKQLESERVTFLAAYRVGGAEGFRALLPGSLTEYFRLTHEDWQQDRFVQRSAVHNPKSRL
jgi:hypothetical protein